MRTDDGRVSVVEAALEDESTVTAKLQLFNLEYVLLVLEFLSIHALGGC